MANIIEEKNFHLKFRFVEFENTPKNIYKLDKI